MAVGRHSLPNSSASQKASPRGASRLVAREPALTAETTPAQGTVGKKVSRQTLRPPINWSALLKSTSWLLLLAVLIGGGYLLGQQLLPYINRPITRVLVEGELPHISAQLVQERVGPFVEQPFFQVDLVGLRQTLEDIPWVSRVELRRVWPDRIIVRLAEQVPIARWGTKALLNNQGQAFIPEGSGNYDHLPYLNGPQQTQQKVMRQYQMLSQMLRPMGFFITHLELHERGSWFLTTNQGIQLLLGRDQVLEKLRRFHTIYQKALEGQRDTIARIDLRHANGLAVAWREPALGPAKPATHGKN